MDQARDKCPPRLSPSLTRVIDRFVHAFAPERIVLFGSYAKGKQHAGSDVDLLIVADLEGDMAQHQQRARQLAADGFPPIDVSFCSQEELAHAAQARSPFLASVLGSGMIVYRRA